MQHVQLNKTVVTEIGYVQVAIAIAPQLLILLCNVKQNIN